jgi:hypothetical protein
VFGLAGGGTDGDALCLVQVRGRTQECINDGALTDVWEAKHSKLDQALVFLADADFREHFVGDFCEVVEQFRTGQQRERIIGLDRLIFLLLNLGWNILLQFSVLNFFDLFFGFLTLLVAVSFVLKVLLFLDLGVDFFLRQFRRKENDFVVLGLEVLAPCRSTIIILEAVSPLAWRMLHMMDFAPLTVIKEIRLVDHEQCAARRGTFLCVLFQIRGSALHR